MRADDNRLDAGSDVKPRVLFITGSLGLGGTELAVFQMIRGLHRRDHVTPWLALINEGGELSRELRREGVSVTELGIRGRLYSPLNALRLLEIAKLVRKVQIDIVQTYLFDADVYAMLAARLGRPPVVITTRRAIKRHKPNHVRAYRWTNRFTNQIIVNSDAVRRFTVDHEHASPEKVVVIPNGIDLDRFASGNRGPLRDHLGADENAVLIGAVGTIRRVKGQAVLYEAMRDLLQTRSDVRLVLIGATDITYAGELKRRVQSDGLDARVHFTGPMQNIPDVLAALDIFVLPSLSEGMSNALIEAMAAGKPIVATDVGGNAENLAGGQVGILVPPDDPSAMRAGICSLLQDPERQMQYGRWAQERARLEYGIESSLERHEDLYKRLLESRGP